MKFEYFSKETIELLRNAHKKACILKFDDVGTDHLLLALTEKVELFESAGYNPWLIHREVSLLLGEGDSSEEPSNYTPRAKQVIEGAITHMEQLQEKEVSPSHVLLSLLSETRGVAIRALTNLDIDVPEFKEKVMQHIKNEKTLA